MTSPISASSSSTSLSLPSLSHRNRVLPALPSPSPSASSSSSGSASRVSFATADDENVTITTNRLSRLSLKGKQKSQEDLRLLAVSTHVTELTYSISDIEARIFEIQELRHKSQSGDASSTSRVIDQSLAQLDERLQFVQDGVAAVAEAIGPAVESHNNSDSDGASGEEEMLLRKHATMLSEWEAVQKESQILREELREDKWLTVFRTVTEQADGMMTSLEKAVNRCQDFIAGVRRYGQEDGLSRSSSSVASLSSDSSPSFEQFNTLLESYEAKKKHYMPATTKVLSIIDKGVQERVTKNGECLRRHAECTQRWRHLKERITRTDKNMESVRMIFLSEGISPSEEATSNTSGTTSQTNGGHLTATPPNGSRSGKSRGSSTISRATSPFRKLARKIAKGAKSPVPSVPATPAVPRLDPIMLQAPSSEPTRALRHRSSLFNLMSRESSLTPDRPSHKHSQSLTPDSSPLNNINQTLKVNRPKWNSSTRVEDDGTRNNTVKSTSRRISTIGNILSLEDQSLLASVTSTPYKRSVSRSSMASSRPWSPVTSSNSTAQSSANQPLASLYRPPSRAQTPGLPTVPLRPRPRTPSHIPRPSLTGGSYFRSISGTVSPSHSSSFSLDDEGSGSLLHRALSPTGRQTPSGHPPRPPSRSMIPVPVLNVHIQGASRPSSAMSNYRPESSMSFRGSAMRVQTPEALRNTPRPSAATPRLPPSSFRDSSAPRTPSRPPSRSGASTPSLDGKPVHVYTPASPRDPLDAEVAAVVNHMTHGLLIERIDPPLRGAPREGEEIRAQYAFSNALGRKIVNCKLTTMTRSGRDQATTTRKVMCRVGGGWQDLPVYIMNRQAGI
ncbi:uncharacterized protein PHACADRAFT_200413 [Phanerochaete carnosa HHB-10118-sp]|uniref:GAR domain-containing protein n=1 Tax=Phanerochaete carnosa (strain HHB-10118-sp) TaxID=650164 RepID=K5WJN8_PHACS|nr:uncharacterized protein PHACADRAFT_200413 [Phanerochaete carnosa HHB-10118-sp]EKM50467.1 hypothetical protein PHACADRAFT_200413 [Phanerochaete carnosa HHB-10118-sp]